MNHIRNFIGGNICLFFLLACQPYPPEVQEALALAGENRQQLIEVLEHYRGKEKQKYQAACFLIAHMPYHRSKEQILTDPSYAIYFRQTDSICQELFPETNVQDIKEPHDSLRLAFADAFSKLPPPVRLSGGPDTEWITADFLIDNIETAFDAWQHSPLIQKMDFAAFREYVLPYRSQSEHPWLRSQLKNTFATELLKEGAREVRTPIERYKHFIDRQRWVSRRATPDEHLGLYDLYIRAFKANCLHLTTWTCDIFRACGIPVAFDFTLQYRDRDRQHFWCVSPDKDGIWKPFTVPENNLMEDWEQELKYVGKVYRASYEVNRQSPAFLTEDVEEELPPNLRTPLMRDVTASYHRTVTLTYDLPDISDQPWAYLCFFSEQRQLQAVAWGKADLRKQQIVFEQVPVNTLFVPAFYEAGSFVPFGAPFFVQTSDTVHWPHPLREETHNAAPCLHIRNDRVVGSKSSYTLSYQSLSPSFTRPQSLLLTRKYPEKREMKRIQEKLRGALFLATNQPDSAWDTLHQLREVPPPYLQQVTLSPAAPYQFYKFIVPDSPVNIAEMEFLGHPTGSSVYLPPTPLPVLSPHATPVADDPQLTRYEGTPLTPGTSIHNAFDHNPETYCGAGSIYMDFSRPVPVSQVRFMPRTAYNTIIPGHRYQLSYWTDSGWRKSDIRTATYHYVEFDNIPSHTVYWLHDPDYGREELAFFYIDGKQHFIHEGLENLPPLIPALNSSCP